MVEPMRGGEPFFLEAGGNTACLLLHGFTSTPQEMRRLGAELHASGLTVLAPLLAGHGTDVRDLRATTYHDWQQSALEGWTTLKQSYGNVFAIGLSLGGTLALDLAIRVNLSGVVTMAAPMMLDTRLLWMARLGKYLLPYRRKGASHLLDAQALAERVSYDHTPTASQEQALLLFRELWPRLPEITAPVLLMHSRHDQTVEPQNMPRIYERLGSADKRMLWLENSGHIVTEDLDRELVYDAIRTFVKQRS